jgi:hypothetical protein
MASAQGRLAAGLLVLGGALNEVDRPGPWWHRLVGLVAAFLLGLGMTNLIAAWTRRRIVLTDDDLRLTDPREQLITLTVPRADVVGAEVVGGGTLRLRLVPGARIRERWLFGWMGGAVSDDTRRSLLRRRMFDVEPQDAAAAYQMILVWIGDGAMSVSARGHVGGAD